MPLFTDPVTINNGADHVLNFLGTIPDRKAMVGKWIEPAAVAAAESQIVVKQDSSSVTVRRRLLQRKIYKETTTRGYRPITINVTATHDVEHTSADVEAELAFVNAILGIAGFGAKFVDGFV